MTENFDFVANCAVTVRDINFEYRKGIKILNDLTFYVPKGQIFALLGPNGCGKTTVIKLILGRLKPKNGSIGVFGTPAGAQDSNIPGPGAGYMPQELALFEEFTIEEILHYYGSIYHMSSALIRQRVDELISILDLPEKSRTIGRLSGGQQRRVSIAVTMIHRPKLIILDEPTVGVDSLLRKRIWNYLEDICQRYGQTVIITTHYIEEARSASTVAFMQSGVVLRQSNPQKILFEFECQTLEDVFIALCYQKINSQFTERGRGQARIESTDTTTCADVKNRCAERQSIDRKRVQAMLHKYFILTLRRPLFLVMFYFVPIVTLTAMRLSIGQNPYNIPLAYYNADRNPRLSKLFLNSIDKSFIKLNEFSDNRTAIESVIRGHNYMSIGFSEDFTETFELRIENQLAMSAEDLDSSEIKLNADMHNTALVLYIFKYIFDAFDKFSHEISKTSGYDIYQFMSPISIQTPIYGDLDLNVTAHFGPSIMIVLAQSLPMVLSALQIIYDRKNTNFERMFVAGVRPTEFYLAHVIQNVALVLSNVLVSMFVSFVLFQNRQVGSIVEVYVMLVLQGILGFSIGLMGALILSDEVSVAVGISGLMFPIWIMSGVLWPLESIPTYFRYLSDLSPITQPLDALRSMMLRGWTVAQPTVVIGYLVTIAYIAVISLVNYVLFKKCSDKAVTLNIWNFSYN